MQGRRVLLALALAGVAIAAIPSWATPVAAGPVVSGRVARPASALQPINVSGAQTARTLRPGDARVPVYVLSVYNPNFLVGSDEITAITFENRTSGGTVAQKDAEFGTLTLQSAARARDVIGVPASGATATGSFNNGLLTFSGLHLTIAPGESLVVVVSGAPTLTARDGDALDMRIHDTNAITMSGGTSLKITGTLDPSGSFPVDGMVATQIGVDTVRTTVLPIGARQQLALALRLPPNGYADDKLTSLEVDNAGTALGFTDLSGMDLWLDNGDGVYHAGDEVQLGTFGYIGNRRWVLTGMATNLNAPAGAKVFVTVDVADGAGEGQTVRLLVPVNGVGVQSNDDGPLDAEAGNPVTAVISLVDRVVLSPVALASGVVRPGAPGAPLFGLTLTNVYSDDRALTGLTLADDTVGPGTIADRDAEIDHLELRLDGDGDRALDLKADPVIATAVFVNGRAFFSGFTLPLGSGKTRALFVTGDVSLLRARDGDALAAMVGTRDDLAFEKPTAVSGSFPLASNNAWTVDGMIAAQIGAGVAPPHTLAPGDGPVEALDLLVRRNGYDDDVLEGVTIVNLGTASPADLSGMHLWRDGGDGTFGAGAGDDVDLGPLTANAGVWTSDPLAAPLGAAGARLFVSVAIDSVPADSATVRLALPVNGLQVASGNDGPLDLPVGNPDALVIANRGLLSSLAFDAGTVTVGQTVTLTMVVRSTASESLLAVAPSAPAPSGTAPLTLLGGPSPASLTLAPGGSGTFQWTFRTDGPGAVRMTAHASATGSPSGQPYLSLDALSGELRAFARADSLPLAAFDAMPQSVSRGQNGVLPLYLTFTHPDSEGSPVRVTGFRVRIEREDGSDVAPAALLARAVVFAASDTLLVRTALETSGATMDLTFATPAIVAPGAPVTLALGFDIAPATVIPDFRVRVLAPGDVHAEDVATAAPVAIALQGAPWPVVTGLARVLDAPTRLDVSADSLPSVRASQSQTEVALGSLTLFNPGVNGVTSDVRVGALDVKLADTLGARIAKPGQVLKRLRLRSGSLTFADRAVPPGADSVVTLTLSPLLAVPVNTPTTAVLVADLSDTASLGAFRVQVGDSARFDARDPNTGNHVPVVYATHPPTGPTVSVEARAESLFVTGSPHLPPAVGLGASSVDALTLHLRHPGGTGTGRLRLSGLTVRCLDESGAPLVPATFLDRMQVTWNGALVASVPDPPASGSSVHATLPDLMLEPGDTASVTLVLDFETTAPASSFALSLGASGLDVFDANLGATAIAAVDSGGDFPLLSGITHIVPPSRTLLVDLADAMPAVLAPDGRDVTAGTLTLLNSAAAGSSPVRVSHLVLRARGTAGALPIGAAMAHAWLAVDGGAHVNGSALTADSSTTLVPFPGGGIDLAPGVPVAVTLGCATRTDPGVPGFALEVQAADVGVVQPVNPLFQVAVLPAPGRAFPLVTKSGTYAAASLAQSWSNFPNPFTPARVATTFAYYLPSSARVTLAIWTARGDRVVTLVADAPRSAGLHQEDVWDGRNGAGAGVVPGVYIADLTVKTDDGHVERLRRKVGVVR